MDTDYYLGFDDANDRALLDVLDHQDQGASSRLKRTLWKAASGLTLAALAVGAYVASPEHAQVASPSSAVLLSDQYSAYGDTSTTTTTTPTDAYGNAIPEGRAVKCGLWKLETFRFTNGERRWYPTATIALSWDPSFLFKFSVVDCNRIPRGADMTLKLPSPTSYPDGQAIKCDPAQSEVFRLIGGKRCWYPSSTIASSWDTWWNNFVVVDCSSLPRGDDMLLNPRTLPEGQSIKCGATASSFFRIVAGKRCAYTSNTVAASWDVNWSAGLAVDCSVLPTGPDLQLNPKVLPEGQAIKCSSSATDIFRLVAGKRCRYPTVEIALSWDKNYSAAQVADCTAVTQGPDLCMNPKELPEGQAVKCSASATEIFRLVAGKRCRYPTSAIALSWDKNYLAALVVDCPTPDGKAIKCSASAPEVFRFVTGGKYRWYPNPAIATSWDATWSTTAVVVDCSGLVRGDDMCLNPKDLPDGKAIKCSASAPEVFRFVTGGKYRWYPNPAIATSWDATWSTTAVVVDCPGLVKGDDMCFNQPDIVNGQAIKCVGQDATKVFRYCDELVRWYPTTSIADSWDSAWKNAVLADCSKFTVGPDMTVQTTTAVASAY